MSKTPYLACFSHFQKNCMNFVVEIEKNKSFQSVDKAFQKNLSV